VVLAAGLLDEESFDADDEEDSLVEEAAGGEALSDLRLSVR
jgi:hypothetical protein